VIGAVAGTYWTPPRRLLASALAFASGALITALADTLMPDAYREGGKWVATAAGFLLSFLIAEV